MSNILKNQAGISCLTHAAAHLHVNQSTQRAGTLKWHIKKKQKTSQFSFLTLLLLLSVLNLIPAKL